MRPTTQAKSDIWRSGDYVGSNRPIVRATIQKGGTKLTTLPYNTYASFIFGSDSTPKELPNIKSMKWTRSVDQDFASCTLELYNTKPLPIGSTPDRDLDQPGYYTFSRGSTSFSRRFGHQPNEWAGLFLPDNVVRTYDGYGFESTLPPELDPHLDQSGTWRIDDVDYTHNGLITLTMRDIGSILADQIVFPPVIPKNFYPLSFAPVPKHSGVIGPKTFTYTVDTGGNFDPAHPPRNYAGPTDGPRVTSRVAGDHSCVVTWQRPQSPDTPATNGTPKSGSVAATPPAKGYKVVGYQFVVDNVRLAHTYPATTFRASVPGLKNGVVYSVHVVAIWRELLTKKGEEYFKTNVEHEEVSSNDNNTDAAVHPSSPNAPSVIPGHIALNTNAQNTLGPGQVRFEYNDNGHDVSWKLIAYKGSTRETFTLTTVAGAGSVAAFDTGSTLGDLTTWNFAVYGVIDDHLNAQFNNPAAASSGTTFVGPQTTGDTTRVPVTGTGDSYLASSGGQFFNPPVGGAPPHDPGPAPTAPTVKTSNGGSKSLTPNPTHLVYSDSSNTYYVGHGADVSVAGHTAAMAFDASTPSYWLSIGNESNVRGSSYEWLEGRLDNVTLSEIQFRTELASYFVYVSVFAKGTWVQHDGAHVIPYNPKDPESHNGGNIPYCETVAEGGGDDEGPHSVVFRTPIPGATKVRITFHNLQDFSPFGIPGLRYRAGVEQFRAFTSLTSTTVAPVVVGPAQDDNSPEVTKSYTNYTPAHIEPGAGENPGTYENYTDIIKLLCAWGGFFWPEHALQALSDGSSKQRDFGGTSFGLVNVDPILGAEGSGRVWGDFEEAALAGAAPLLVPQFDKKTLMDAISYVRDVIGYIFYVDEEGGVVWRNPNVFAAGNWIGNLSKSAGRVDEVVEIDEKVTLIGLHAKLTGRNLRERTFVAAADGRHGGLAVGYNPNPVGLRRVGGWTDFHFNNDGEAQVTAELIALRQLFTYRTDQLTIPAYSVIQVDDQVRIFEAVTGEGYLHYVKGINCTLDMESGQYTYELATHWLGERPFDLWVFDPVGLSDETKNYLAALAIPAGAGLPTGLTI